MDYLVEGTKYSLSYSELKEQYLIHCNMTDEEFLFNLPSALHTACIICFFKEIPTYVCLSDKGIVHELVHLLHLRKDTIPELPTIRELFKNQLKLA